MIVEYVMKKQEKIETGDFLSCTDDLNIDHVLQIIYNTGVYYLISTNGYVISSNDNLIELFENQCKIYKSVRVIKQSKVKIVIDLT